MFRQARQEIEKTRLTSSLCSSLQRYLLLVAPCVRAAPVLVGAIVRQLVFILSISSSLEEILSLLEECADCEENIQVQEQLEPEERPPLLSLVQRDRAENSSL